MFRPSLICRVIIVVLWLVGSSVLTVLTQLQFLFYAVPVVAFWLWLYLSHMKIKISAGYLVRSTGNIFKHKSIILLKNIFFMQIITFLPWRPAIIRLRSRGDTLIIIGLDGRQAEFLEKIIEY